MAIDRFGKKGLLYQEKISKRSHRFVLKTVRVLNKFPPKDVSPKVLNVKRFLVIAI